MIAFRRPSDADLDRTAARLSGAEPTFDSSSPSASYHRDAWSHVLAATTTWDQARDAIRRWEAHRGAGVRVRPTEPPAVGLTVALAFPVGPVHVMAPCRVVSVTDTAEEYGFTYATLPGHPERGEERFALKAEGDGIAFHISAVSQAADLLTRLGGPVSRRLQTAVTRRYLSLNGLG